MCFEHSPKISLIYFESESSSQHLKIEKFHTTQNEMIDPHAHNKVHDSDIANCEL